MYNNRIIHQWTAPFFMARKTKEEALKTYHAILDASAELFSNQGISHTTLNDIAKHTGMTRGAVYWHFENKEDVIKALWQRDAADRLDKTLGELTNLNKQTPVEHFKTIVKNMVRNVSEDTPHSIAVRIVINSGEATTIPSDLQAFLDDKGRRIFDAFCQATQTLQDLGVATKEMPSNILAASLWSYIHGLVDLNLRSGDDRINLSESGDQLLEFYFQNWFK
jgi:AcrR family transcriptional regulator